MTTPPDSSPARLLSDVSLWSADLANLGAEIRRLDPFADSFHIDVCDAHFAPSLLFFPDLVRSLRSFTDKPFHVHLMVERPIELIPEFMACGADLITVHVEVGRSEVERALAAIRGGGCAAGLALRLETAVEEAVPYLDCVDSLLLLGTALGVKGQNLATEACGRLGRAAALRGARHVRLVADGGIRPHTVPALRRAGADVIVPGSLVFQSANLAETFSMVTRIVRAAG